MKIRILTLLAALILAVTPVCSHASARYATATFAGGCFWCMEQAFEKLPGVVSVVQGTLAGLLKIDLRAGERRRHKATSKRADHL
jgi:hypothetical protein